MRFIKKFVSGVIRWANSNELVKESVLSRPDELVGPGAFHFRVNKTEDAHFIITFIHEKEDPSYSRILKHYVVDSYDNLPEKLSVILTTQALRS